MTRNSGIIVKTELICYVLRLFY
ncbi:hypothetical protein BRAS3809_2880004 [Bradyrhizobium sp. STM 3809]|nr:hypothetical protein BRAS3809_2880004 [Bradyrhizobium sp. STM 3809]